ncbi:DUF1129 family protein [Bacillus sp. B1-b2]|uniref:DUF1129 family protein n=1 Tax=Bacillus sp. B1-b2 TaxID=2653201 RepID=UPI00186A9D0E|nr:DUF1048 domain-containing protein [Bacillus sp. B1-b2]
MALSKEAQNFIDNMYLYLMASGKNEQEMKEITEELSNHLEEAEANGKNIKDITGASPKEYMENLAKEMDTDMKGWGKLIPHIFISLISYSLIGKIILGESTFSLWVGIGSLLICVFMLGVYVFVFRFTTARNQTNRTFFLLLLSLQILSTALFILLMFYGNSLQPVFLIEGFLARFFVFCIPFAYLCWFAWWSKSFVVFVPLMIYVPNMIVDYLPLTEEKKAIYSSILLSLIMLGYLLTLIASSKKEKTE